MNNRDPATIMDTQDKASGTCCAHTKVVLKHIDYPSGTRSDYWVCPDCHQEFRPVISLKDMPVSGQHHFDNVSTTTPDPTCSRRAEMLDYFAAHALQGLCANEVITKGLDELCVKLGKDASNTIATMAYEYAESMLVEREKWVK